ncbi:MAG: DMT family transporter, partial [Gammaproteobacteria bacterium]|nr:DMT family transporter [Gammaproteobacteria bacterium]
MTFAQRYPISPSALAVAMVLVACAFFAGASLVAKVLAISSAEAALHPLQLAFGRFLAGTLMLTPILAWKGKRAITSAVPALYLVRSGCSVGAISCIFAAVASLPLADVTALNYASPFFTLILARLVLKEAVNRARWVAVAIGFCGVVFIANPSGSTLHPMTLIALLSAVFMAGELISLRDVLWAIRNDRFRTVAEVEAMAGRDAGPGALGGYLV